MAARPQRGIDTVNTPPSVDVLGDTVDHGSMLERPLTQAERAIELPRYTLLDVIGQGGFGRVYAAHDPVLDRTVAIKLLRRAPSSMMLDGSTSRIRSQQRAQRKLLREAHALAKLGHPNIVAVYDAGTYARPDDDEREGVFIVMEYIDGLTLDRWLTAAPRTWSEILAVFRAAGEGLVVAHAKGFCHRDFKPGNIMVTREGAVKVLDFGLASAQRNERTEPIRPLSSALEAVGVAGDTTTPTQADHIIGTPAYMAPEQWLGRATGPHSDQFSFCLALYEAIFGRSPFPGAKLEERIASLLQARYDPAPEDSPVPPRVIEAVRRGLAFRYQERYSSMSALLDALDLGVTFTTGVTAATIPNRSFHEHNTSREEQRAYRVAHL